MSIRKTLATLLTLLVALSPVAPGAQDAVLYRTRLSDGSEEQTRAILRLPAASPGPQSSAPAKAPALVILHHAGGFDAGTTAQHARFFADKGFVTLEPVLFERPTARAPMGATSVDVEPQTVHPCSYDLDDIG